MGATILRRVLSPVPFSCLLHVLFVLALAFFIGAPHHADAPKEAEVVLPVSPEEMPVRETRPKESYNPFAEPAVCKDVLAPAPKEAQTEDTASSSPAERPAAQVPQQAGSQAILSEREAVTGGDGAPAVGTGNPTAAAGGAAVAGGDTGHYEAGAAGTADEAAPAPPAPEPPRESLSSIANRFVARVEANKEYPYMAMRRSLEGSVTVSVTIAEDGALVSAGVASSSGVSDLDANALAAVRASCPFPHGAGRTITLDVPVQFFLQ